jgi:rhodanese-related sulfurtransferase
MVGDASPPDGVTGRQDAAILDAVSAAPDADKSGCKADGGPASLVRLSPLELKTLLAGSEDPYLINVKGASIGTIAGTDAVLVNDIAGIETLVGHDLCANIILYCQSGNTSSSVAAQLLAKGYQRIRDLAGGITAWKNAGYPTE